MDHILCGNGIQAAHGKFRRQNIAEGFLCGVKIRLCSGAVHAEAGGLHLFPVLFQIGNHIVELVAQRMAVTAGKGTGNFVAQGVEPGTPHHREIIRHDPVVVQQRQVEEIPIQCRFQLTGRLALTAQQRRNDFLLKGIHLNMDNGSFALTGVVALPERHALLVFGAVVSFQLSLCQCSEDFPICCCYHEFLPPEPIFFCSYHTAMGQKDLYFFIISGTLAVFFSFPVSNDKKSRPASGNQKPGGFHGNKILSGKTETGESEISCARGAFSSARCTEPAERLHKQQRSQWW